MIYKIFDKLNKLSFFPYYIVTPSSYGIGTAADNILTALRKNYKSKKKIFVIVPHIFQKLLKYKVCNKSIFFGLNLYKFNFIDKIIYNFFFIIINFIFFFTRSFVLANDRLTKFKIKESIRFPAIGTMFEFNEKMNFNDISSAHYDTIINKHRIELKDNIKKNCEKTLHEIGVKRNDKIICIHVRDGSYTKDPHRAEGYSGARFRDIRNSSINNYKKSINYLLKKNFWVIRMGHKVDNKVNIKHPKFIDYPFSTIKNDSMDLYLIKRSSFVICTQSGLLSIALLYNKPILQTNAIRIFQSRSENKLSRTLFKIPFWKKNNKKIYLKEYINMPYFYHHCFFLDNKIGYKENSSDEIYQGTKEILRLIKNKKKTTNLQKKFNIFLIESFRKHYYSKNQEKGTSLRELDHAFNLIASIKNGKNAYCDFFLKKYYN